MGGGGPIATGPRAGRGRRPGLDGDGDGREALPRSAAGSASPGEATSRRVRPLGLGVAVAWPLTPLAWCGEVAGLGAIRVPATNRLRINQAMRLDKTCTSIREEYHPNL